MALTIVIILKQLMVNFNLYSSGKSFIVVVLDSAFFPGRCANIIYKKVVIGKIGVLHPTVLQGFELVHPVSIVEFNIEPFV